MDQRQQLHDGRLDRVSMEYRFLHPTHGEKWLHQMSRVSRRDAAGRTILTFGVLRDITERKRAEEERRDLSRRLIHAHEEERALLARELHDDVTQRLAVLAIEAGRAELAAPDGEQAQVMRTVREALVRISEDVHSLAYQLHPAVLEEIGLAAALQAECERTGRRGRAKLSVELDPLTAEQLERTRQQLIHPAGGPASGGRTLLGTLAALLLRAPPPAVERFRSPLLSRAGLAAP
jgi:signal transduction histidine kinase